MWRNLTMEIFSLPSAPLNSAQRGKSCPKRDGWMPRIGTAEKAWRSCVRLPGARCGGGQSWKDAPAQDAQAGQRPRGGRGKTATGAGRLATGKKLPPFAARLALPLATACGQKKSADPNGRRPARRKRILCEDSWRNWRNGRGARSARPARGLRGLTLHVDDGFQHGVSGGDALGVGLEAALGGDHLHELGGHVHVGLFDAVAEHPTEAVVARHAQHGIA